MANVLQQKKPGFSSNSALMLFAAGMVGITYASFVGRAFQPGEVQPAETLQQAITQFDAGALPAAETAFAKLAAAGDPHAAYWYGHALDFGLGTAPNATAAIGQYEKAWTGGVLPAGTRLGELYAEGSKVAPDFVKARGYLSEAAMRGDARAAFDYGQLLRDGIGGPADPVQAYAWLDVASMRGEALANSAKDQLLTKLQPAQQQAAAAQVAELLKSPAATPPTPAPTLAPAKA